MQLILETIPVIREEDKEELLKVMPNFINSTWEVKKPLRKLLPEVNSEGTVALSSTLGPCLWGGFAYLRSKRDPPPIAKGLPEGLEGRSLRLIAHVCTSSIIAPFLIISFTPSQLVGVTGCVWPWRSAVLLLHNAPGMIKCLMIFSALHTYNTLTRHLTLPPVTGQQQVYLPGLEQRSRN